MPKRRRHYPGAPAETVRVPTTDDSGRIIEQRTATLIVIQGAEYDLGRHVRCERPVTIGRDVNVELPLSDGSISRRHCTIERLGPGAYQLVDLGSTNGTRIGGRRVHNTSPLCEGDKIFVGASAIRFSYHDALDIEFHDRLEELYTTDALTGMVTKRQYDAAFEAVADRARAASAPLSLLVMDMDGLKQVNDSHGHEMGGFVIAETAALIRAAIDDCGIVCRFGGDEFVACLPGIALPEAEAIAEAVRAAVESHAFVHDGIEVAPTLSVGVAGYPVHVDDPTILFAAADRALYAAKRAGKNQVATAGVGDEPTRIG